MSRTIVRNAWLTQNEYIFNEIHIAMEHRGGQYVCSHKKWRKSKIGDDHQATTLPINAQIKEYTWIAPVKLRKYF